MKLGFLIIVILVFEMNTYGCKTVSRTDTIRTLIYTVTVTSRESEATIPFFSTVFIKFGVMIVSMQNLCTAQQQVQYRITRRCLTEKKLNELREELLNHADVLTVEIERTYPLFNY